MNEISLTSSSSTVSESLLVRDNSNFERIVPFVVSRTGEIVGFALAKIEGSGIPLPPNLVIVVLEGC